MTTYKALIPSNLGVQVMAEVMGAEAALVRTHAIAAALFACLPPEDEMLAVVGNASEWGGRGG